MRHESWLFGRDSNAVSPEYKSNTLRRTKLLCRIDTVVVNVTVISRDRPVIPLDCANLITFFQNYTH
jgi:hypothetical protein